jgi:two-component system chemotaxis response regulator CheB
MNTPIRVVVVDDSPFVCHLLTSYLQASPDIRVVGTALNGARAIRMVQELKPDVVTLDLEMPQVNGLEAVEQIMDRAPTPIILISGTSRQAAALTLLAIELGAVDFILKYTPGVDTDPEALRREIIAKVRAASQTRVFRLRAAEETDLPVASLPPRPALAAQDRLPPLLPGGVVVIGASTGGPLALRQLLGCLRPDFPASVIVVQHMPETFTGVLAEQLNRQTPLRVKEAENNELLQAATVYVAPGGFHLLLRPDSRIELNQGPEIAGHRPSIDVAMQSVAQVYGPRTTGVVLTGMGDDGAMGLVAIRAKGGLTFAQDPASCVVSGMPQRAVDRHVVDHVAEPEAIAQMLARPRDGRVRVC